jgi:hypothetical protein
MSALRRKRQNNPYATHNAWLRIVNPLGAKGFHPVANRQHRLHLHRVSVAWGVTDPAAQLTGLPDIGVTILFGVQLMAVAQMALSGRDFGR